MVDDRLPLLPLILANVPQGLRQALAQEGVPVRDRRRGPPEGRFLLFDSRTRAEHPPAAGQIAVDVGLLRRGFDGDPFDALVDERSGRFSWEVAGLTLTEEIARVDKRAVRQEILERLRRIIQKAGGVWLRVAAFPFPYRSAVSFRIDYDNYDPKDFDATLAAIVGNENATSHFVSGAAYESAPEALARLRGLDVGSHGYWHHTYRTAEENLRNVGRGIRTLRAAKIEPSGFAAPHGRFNRGLLSALLALGVSHSSEFGLAYDELPFLVGSTDVLQVPVHPVSLGLFLDAAAGSSARCSADVGDATRAAVEAAIDYFDQFARSRYRSGRPVFLYGHPTGRLGRYPQVLRRLFDTVSHFGAIWKTTFGEFCNWWRARAQVQLTVTSHEGLYGVRVDRPAPGYRLGIEHCRGRHVALMPLDDRVLQFSSAAIAYENRTVAASVFPVRIDGSHGIRGRVRQLIDWERVTPIDEIGSGNWRNWAKRTLRRLRGG